MQSAIYNSIWVLFWRETRAHLQQLVRRREGEELVGDALAVVWFGVGKIQFRFDVERDNFRLKRK